MTMKVIQISTRKMPNERYRVLVNGKQTSMVVEKSDRPKYRERQEWSIGIQSGGDLEKVSWLCYDQPGKLAAMETVRRIIEAADVS